MLDMFTDSGALFSECRSYRYMLWRFWEQSRAVNFVMLNPSTADEVTNDPTVERCERRARAMGYGGLIVTNLFAWRATDPRELRRTREPIGQENDAAIISAAGKAGLVICGWGVHGEFMGRGKCVREILLKYRPHCLRLTAGGEPQHPLYIGYDVKPFLWE